MFEAFKKSLIISIFFFLITGLASCTKESDRQFVLVDTDQDGLIMFPEQIDATPSAQYIDRRFVQEIIMVEDPLGEDNRDCSSDYNGIRGNSPWVSESHRSLSSVTDVERDNMDNMWVATVGKGVSMFNGSDWSQWSWDDDTQVAYSQFPGLDAGSVVAVAAIDYEPVTGAKTTSELDHKGAILMFDGHRSEWIDLEAPFDVADNDDNMAGLAVGHNGEVYVPFTSMQNTHQADELDGNRSAILDFVDALLGDRQATQSDSIPKGNLGIFHEGDWEIIEMPPLPIRGLSDAKISSNGSYWLATKGAGVWMYDGNNWSVFSTWEGHLPSNYVTGIAETDEGYFWAASLGGLALIDEEGRSIVLNNEDYPFGLLPPEDIVIDNENRLWLLSDEGMLVYNGREWSKFGTRGGAPRNWSYNLASDRDGCIWAVYSGGAMAQIFRNQINMDSGEFSAILNDSNS
jgi:ligand-binding sensor domain-containing protein